LCPEPSLNEAWIAVRRLAFSWVVEDHGHRPKEKNMRAYLICMVRVDDVDTYKKYTAQTPALIEKHGGRFLVRGGAVEAIEGEPFHDRLVVLEFPSKEAVHKFYGSPEYQEVLKIRRASSASRFLLAEGTPEGVVAPNDQVIRSTTR
jgi:uncharacterized protein (DUF1330 family)